MISKALLNEILKEEDGTLLDGAIAVVTRKQYNEITYEQYCGEPSTWNIYEIAFEAQEVLKEKHNTFITLDNGIEYFFKTANAFVLGLINFKEKG